MQKLPLEVDAWRPVPLIMRTKSGNGRDKKKVSCETLSKVDWYSRRPYEAQLYYHSDDDEEDNPASDAEAEEDVEYGTDGRMPEDDKDNRSYVEKLASHGYGADGLSSQGLHFLGCFHSRAPPERSAMALSSPGRDAKKTEKIPRTYPSPIPHSGSLLPHSGSLLPHSGRLLPHSGPIKLHVGSHANTHVNKVSGSARGSTFLIPSNIGGKSSKSGFGNANEPSSPKVTCFGRVKIRHKYCRDMGRLADMAGGAHNDNVHKTVGDQMMKLTRKKNKAHTVEEDTAPTKERQKPLRKEADLSSRVSVRSGDEKRASKAWSLSSAGTTPELQKSRHGWAGYHGGDDVLIADAASDSETKGRKGKWRLKESGVHMKFRRAEKKSQTRDALDAPHGSSDCAIDMNRFHPSQRPQMRENRVSKSLASLSINDESSKFEQTDDTEFVPQVPPPNSLLLMRNSKSRAGAPCATIAASSTYQRHRADNYEESVLVDRQVPPSALKEESSKKQTSALSGANDNETTNFVAAANGHVAQVASFADVVSKQCVVAPAECTPFLLKAKAQPHRQVSLPKLPHEGARLWQRRSVMKLSPLDVGKPLNLQIKEPSTR